MHLGKGFIMSGREAPAEGEDITEGNIDGTSSTASRRRWDWRTPFISLRNRNFRIFTIGSLVSITALQMQQLAQNYLVYQLTGMATAIGYVSAAVGGSMLVFSFAGGIAADRVGKRKLLAISQLGIAVFALFIGLMITMELIQVWHIVVTSVAIGILAAFNNPARQSYVPDLVGTEHLMNALALSSGIMNMTRIAGPALAGVLIGIFGVGPLYYTKFVAYCIFVTVLLFIPIAGKASSHVSRSFFKEALDGLRYLRSDRRVLNLLILAVVPVVFGMPYVNFLPVFQEAVFHVGPAELGVMMAVVGGGAVVGSMAIASLGDYRHKGRILLASGLGFGATLVLFAIVANTGAFVPSLVILALVGGAGTAYMALNNALVMMLTPAEMRGRVMGVFMTTFGLMPLGSLPMGILSDTIGAPLTVGIFGGIVFGFIALMALLRPEFRQL